MPMKESVKIRLTEALKKFIMVAVMMLICIVSVFSVMGFVSNVTVIDDGRKITFELATVNEEKILERSLQYGVKPLGTYDVSSYDEEHSILTINRGVQVKVSDSGQDFIFTMKSSGLSQSEILSACETRFGIVPVSPNDKLSFDEKNFVLSINRAVSVSFTHDGKTEPFLLYSDNTVQDLLSLAGITPGDDTILSHEASTPLYNGMTVRLLRKLQVTITADGKTASFTVAEGTAEEAVLRAGIVLGKDDLLNVDRSSQIADGMTLTVRRVSYRDVEKQQEVPYETIYEDSTDLDSGETKVKTKGATGLCTVQIREKLVDGEVVDTEELSKTVTKEPVTEVILTGKKTSSTWFGSVQVTYGQGTVTDFNGNQLTYKAVYYGKASAYYGGGNCSTGVPAQVGYIAVNPNVIPYGSKLYIVTADGRIIYGYAVAADTGGAVMGGNYVADLYYDTLAECSVFGIRYVYVYLLN